MTTSTDTRTTTDRMRELLAFGLDTAEAIGVPLHHIKASQRGDELELWVDGYDAKDDVLRLAEAVGVTATVICDNEGSTFSVRSRGQWSPWERKEIESGATYPYSGRSVPFGDRLIEVGVICSLSKV